MEELNKEQKSLIEAISDTNNYEIEVLGGMVILEINLRGINTRLMIDLNNDGEIINIDYGDLDWGEE